MLIFSLKKGVEIDHQNFSPLGAEKSLCLVVLSNAQAQKNNTEGFIHRKNIRRLFTTQFKKNFSN